MARLFAVIFLCLQGPACSSYWATGFQMPIPRRRIFVSTPVLHARSKKSGASTRGRSGGEGFGRQQKLTVKEEGINSDDPLGFSRYFEKEGLKLPSHMRNRLVQISSSPLMFTIDEFIDAESCARAETSESIQLLFRQKVAAVLFQDQSSAMDGLRFNSASSSDLNNDSSAAVTFPDGIHMDTNNECIFRHVTAILYLNNVPVECGGATIFPLARALETDPALLASRRLLEEKISHTRSCGLVRRSGVRREDDAKVLESRVGSNFVANPNIQTAIRVQPKMGRLLLFFSRTADGMDDPRAWHGGERLRHGVDTISGEITTTEKRILTLFKQVDYGKDSLPMSTTTFEAFLAPQIIVQREYLTGSV